MRHVLTDKEKEALRWMVKNSPVFSVKRKDPSLLVIRRLVSKRLVQADKVVRHPTMPNFLVTKFAITRKGKKYNQKLSMEEILHGESLRQNSKSSNRRRT